MKITIPGEFTGLNQLTNANRTHWAKGAKIKAEEEEWVRLSLLEQKAKPVKSYPVTLSFSWYTKDKRRDPDNVASSKKVLIDGLVRGGVLRGDGWGEIAMLNDEFYVDKDEPRVEILILEKK